MRIALVHDYLKDAGGAERVLRVLADLYPNAPIYTAFKVENSDADRMFKGRKIHESFLAPVLKIWRLYSPLRFLLPVVWWSLDLSKYDLVITSSSNYIAKGFRVSPKTKVIAYCHTPPRFLYGFKTGYDWKKNIIVRIYGEVIGYFLRIFDKVSAAKINYWIANSKNVQERIKRFYGRDSVVIYPPVEVQSASHKFFENANKDYFLIVSRLVGSKGLFEAVRAANELNVNLKIVGSADGFTSVSDKLKKVGGKNVEFLGRVEDSELWGLYANAKGFMALARDEDFGMTVAEAQAFGTAVIAFNGGGFRESVINGKTGILINDTDTKTIEGAIRKFNRIKWDKKAIKKNAERFSRERFEKEVVEFVNKIYAGTS